MIIVGDYYQISGVVMRVIGKSVFTDDNHEIVTVEYEYDGFVQSFDPRYVPLGDPVSRL